MNVNDAGKIPRELVRVLLKSFTVYTVEFEWKASLIDKFLKII
jgi:hypothetical protein